MPSGLLIASPSMVDRYFHRTVVLLCQFDEEGAFGLVINRTGPVSIGDVTEAVKVAPPVHPHAPTWWGGPVNRETCHVIWRGQADADEGWTLGNEIAVSGALTRLEQLVQTNRPFHLALGYTGWAPEQLQDEIERGSWLLVDADPALVFETPMEARYDHALALLGLSVSTVNMTPGDA